MIEFAVQVRQLQRGTHACLTRQRHIAKGRGKADAVEQPKHNRTLPFKHRKGRKNGWDVGAVVARHMHRECGCEGELAEQGIEVVVAAAEAAVVAVIVVVVVSVDAVDAVNTAATAIASTTTTTSTATAAVFIGRKQRMTQLWIGKSLRMRRKNRIE